MNELLKMAEHLGRRIASNERTILLRQAQEALSRDESAKQLIDSYQQQASKIRACENSHMPVEVEDKHKLEAIEQQISGNALIRDLTRRQADFVEMMHKVKQAIDSQLEFEPPS